ncbi:MAG: phosphoribosyltransferase [Methanosarcinaceae archaeon]|nr:phosphoribosyltransferase [Methanosarcinaceae archaeon]
MYANKFPPADRSSFKCHLMSFSESYTLSRILARKIRDSGYVPDLMIAIGRGGYVPGRVVSDLLLFNDLTTFKIEHYTRAANIQETAKVKYPLSVDIHGKKILVVDDVTDTGDTLRLAVEYLKTMEPLELRTAVLQHKTCSGFIPDYYARKIIKWRWIIYPWAAYEDLAGFAEKIIGSRTLTAAQIASEFSSRYSIEVKEKYLMEILEDLHARGETERINRNENTAWRLTEASCPDHR